MWIFVAPSVSTVSDLKFEHEFQHSTLPGARSSPLKNFASFQEPYRDMT